MSFQKLFRSADEEYGLTDEVLNNLSLKYTFFDTSELFDNANDKNSSEDSKLLKEKGTKFRICEPESIIWRSSTARIIVPSQPKTTSSNHNKYTLSQTKVNQQTTMYNNHSIIKQTEFIPTIDWDNQINSIMEASEDEDDYSEHEYSPDNDDRECKIIKHKHIKIKNSLGNKLEEFNLFPATLTHRIFLPHDIIPPFCFDPDYVDINEEFDPLDVIIPNFMEDSTNNKLFDIKNQARIGLLNETNIYEFHDNDLIEDQNPYMNNVNKEINEITNKSNPKTVQFASPQSQTQPTTSSNRQSNANNLSTVDKQQAKTKEKIERLRGVSISFDAAASIEQSVAAKRPRDNNLPTHRNRVRSFIAALNHNSIANSHRNTKPDLLESELRYFHRPRMNKERDRPWQISLKNSTKKQATGATHSRLSFSEEDKLNLSLANNTVNFILLEYMEEFPPVMLNYGMASAIFNYYRTSEDDELEEERRQKARLDSAQLVQGLTSNNLDPSTMNGDRKCRLPRHVMLLLQQRHVKQPYEFDVNIPRLQLGETKLLSADDESPFLGNIEKEEIQPSFTNNLFRAPIFRHKPLTTDFLLIRTKLMNKLMTYAIREIPYVYLCGQLEPQKIVPRASYKITGIQEKFYMLHASRFLHLKGDHGADYSELQKSILKYCLKDKIAPHKGQHRTKLKAILKMIADEVRDHSSNGGVKWIMKDFEQIANDPHEATELEKKYSPEELAKTFTPEDVCLQESCNATEYRLFQQHIVDLSLSRIESWLTRMHKLKQYKMDRAEKVKRLANSNRDSTLSPFFDQTVKVLIKDIQRLDTKLSIARFIFERLVQAPWNTTEAFVKSHLERDGLGKMEIQGKADPSGRGEGFSFVRIIKQIASGPVTKKQQVQLVNTDKDLRKLTKEDAIRLLVAAGVPLPEAKALKRWDRIHMIREISNKSEKLGIANHIHKYARGSAFKSVAATATINGETFAEICQQIWNRQKAALGSGYQIESQEEVKSKERRGRIKTGDENEKTLSVRATINYPSNRDRDEDDNANNSSTNKRLNQHQMNERRELNTIGSILDGSNNNNSNYNNNSNGASAGQRRIGMSESIKFDAGNKNSSEIAPAPYWNKPRQVVKQICRRIGHDGVEHITIRFVLSEREVRRVSDVVSQIRVEKEKRRLSLFGDLFKNEEEDFSEHHSRSRHRGMVDDDEDVLIPISTSANSMNLNIGAMKKMIDQNNKLQEKKDGALDSFERGYLNKSSKHNKRSQGSGPSGLVNTTGFHRIPRVLLAARFEREIMDLWNLPMAEPFRNPIDRISLPQYYEKIQQPICLLDMRNKIANLKYETADALKSDFNLMVRNAEQFNGVGSPIAQAANKLLVKLQQSLVHERKHFGVDNDSILKLEEAIHKKNLLFKRHLPGVGVTGNASIISLKSLAPSASTNNLMAPTGTAAATTRDNTTTSVLTATATNTTSVHPSNPTINNNSNNNNNNYSTTGPGPGPGSSATEDESSGDEEVIEFG
eukprot:gene9931-13360_t